MERRNSLRAINGEANDTNNMKASGEMKPQPKAKASCKNNNTRGGEEKQEEEEEESGFPWPPPRAYKCGFCKRQFRSAQALGGHMNVHRRDRAKLRRSPPMDSSFSASSEPIKYLKLSDLSSFNNGEEDANGGGCEIWKKMKKLVRMEKEISLVGSSNEIDLELRLGF